MNLSLSLTPPGVASTRPPTRRSCAVAASLGLSLDEPAPTPPSTLSLTIAPNTITLITGPSGSGKTTLLRAIRRRLRALDSAIIEPPAAARLRDRPAIDLIDGPLEYAVGALARAGLAEASCLVRRPGELSEGQRERLRLAIALDRAQRSPANSPVVLLLDEFCASLDRQHARAVGALLHRFITRSRVPVSAIIATPRDDLAPWLAPHARITCSLAAPPAFSLAPPAQPRDPLDAVRIERGDRADYLALAPLHYRARQPATFALMLRALHHESPSSEPILAGAMVISMPTLNARWRARAWPGRFDTPDKSLNAHRLNDELRAISRVVIDPRFRSLGLASRMVRHYLANPLTPCTEAIAALAHASPFFERAGMTPYPLTPSQRDARLLDALAHLDLEPWRLATPDLALRRALDASPISGALLERELRAWANAAGATRALTGADLPTIFRAAARSLACSSIAYAHTASD